MLLWRETTLTIAAAASDVVVRRGIKNTTLRPGSTGFLATDVLADTAINLSDPGAASLTDNSLAQRGVLPTGPTVVLCATALVAFSLLAGAARGRLRRRQLAAPVAS